MLVYGTVSEQQNHKETLFLRHDRLLLPPKQIPLLSLSHLNILMSKERHIHWLTPTTSLLSFTCGVALAIVHHIFYSSLNNTAVNADVYNFAGFRVSQQQINMATGTTLAFLSRACFLVTLSSAYTQQFWLLVGRHGRQTRVNTLDVMYGALDNVWNLCRVGVWWKRPFLLLTGVVSW